MTHGDALGVFHPTVSAWFRERVGEPTEVQRLVWPRAAAGEHLLATAPTGSGKTLSAFLWALDRLFTGAWATGRVRVLYVSPLKALNTDIARNLTVPLMELSALFAASGEPVPAVRAAVRSGDTPEEERRKMLRQPPEILITTPESLNILLTSRRGRELLSGLATVILDEIHAVVGSKRGVHLITAVERLVPLAGEVQRLGLSATVRPLERVATWMGGYEPVGGGSGAGYRPRRVSVVEAASVRTTDLSVRFPAASVDTGAWEPLVAEVRRVLGQRRSTLVFANSRRVVEKLTRLVNEDEGGLAWSHHGSLSREIRAVVEARLKAGELRGIVATSSLELGIDIGALEQVVLVQTPPSVASAVQRIGRSGHGVGETSRGLFLPLVPRDLLDAAVVASAVAEGAIEPVRPVRAPLDVLAQVLVSMTANETWLVDDLFAAVCAADPYHELSRRQFDLVMEMLAGRYADLRMRDVRPIVSIDRVAGTVRGRPGAERRVYMSGGTIPDRGYFHLRVSGAGALIGELDEEFVWERSVGDTFTLGVQGWRIESITHNDVIVTPIRGRAAMAPFWRSEEQGRSFQLSERIGDFLGRAEARLDTPESFAVLAAESHLESDAAAALRTLLFEQRHATGVLPTRRRVVVERVESPQSAGEISQIILHTFWGGQVNRPLALVLAAAWERRFGITPEIVHDDDTVVLGVAGDCSDVEPLTLAAPVEIEALLRERLERTGLFGARFREAAGRALLLPREGFSRRTPLWLSRQRAKTLLEAVSRFDDFPLVLEAWRECLQEAFDLEALRQVLEEVRDGRIEVHTARTSRPSPFAANAAWKRTNQLMYEDDTPTGAGTRLRPDLLREVVFAAHLRPRLEPALADTLTAKLQRTYPGYAPGTQNDLLDWVVERVVIPEHQWRDLLDAVARDHPHQGGGAAWVEGLADRLAVVGTAGGELVAAVEALPRVLTALGLGPSAVRPIGVPAGAAAPRGFVEAAGDAPEGAAATFPELIADLLRFHGPVPTAELEGWLGVAPQRLRGALEALVGEDRIVIDQLTVGASAPEVCDAENLERLLRIVRAGSRSTLDPVPAEKLPLFLASWQRLAVSGAGIGDLQQALERLMGYGAAAEVWETEILPARLDPYHPSWLDALCAGSGLHWLGVGKRRVAFVFPDDLDLIVDADAGDDTDEGALLPAGGGRFPFEELAVTVDMESAELARRLWQLAWEGRVTNDTFDAVRQGLAHRFRPAELGPPAEGRRRQPRRQRWQSSRPFPGAWRRVPRPMPPGDPLEREELARDRVRLLLDRYGVIFRELVGQELATFSWGRLFRTLRLMELSGEVVAGRFFDGVPGIQFASPAAVRKLQEGVAGDLVWWVNAVDPASCCGLGIEGLAPGLPRRVVTSHVVFCGARPVLVSERRGRRLTLSVTPDDPALESYLQPLRNLLVRPVLAMRSIVVDSINDQEAAVSPFRRALEAVFHVVRDGGSLRLGRRW